MGVLSRALGRGLKGFGQEIPTGFQLWKAVDEYDNKQREKAARGEFVKILTGKSNPATGAEMDAETDWGGTSAPQKTSSILEAMLKQGQTALDTEYAKQYMTTEQVMAHYKALQNMKMEAIEAKAAEKKAEREGMSSAELFEMTEKAGQVKDASGKPAYNPNVISAIRNELSQGDLDNAQKKWYELESEAEKRRKETTRADNSEASRTFRVYSAESAAARDAMKRSKLMLDAAETNVLTELENFLSPGELASFQNMPPEKRREAMRRQYINSVFHYVDKENDLRNFQGMEKTTFLRESGGKSTDKILAGDLGIVKKNDEEQAEKDKDKKAPKVSASEARKNLAATGKYTPEQIEEYIKARGLK